MSKREGHTISGSNHGSKRSFVDPRGWVRNIGAHDNTCLFPEEGVVAFVKETGRATKLSINFHANIGTILRLCLGHMSRLETYFQRG